MMASQGRMIVAWIIDLIVLSVPLTYLKLALPFKSGSAPVAELGAYLLAFIILRLMIAATVGSPGYHCMAIDFDGKVNQSVKGRETILTILLGVLVIAGGRQWLLQWQRSETVLPVFGMMLPADAFAIVSIGIGLFYMTMGLLVLNMTRLGFYLAMAGAAVSLTSAVASWDQLDTMVGRLFLEEATAQGIPAIPMMMEILQRFTRWASIAPTIVFALIVALHAKRFDVLADPDDNRDRRVSPRRQ